MKRNVLKKIISMLLVMTMLIPLASPVFGAEEEEENHVMSYQSDARLQGIGGDGDSQLFGGGFGGWGLKTLAGGTVSGLVGIGLNQAYQAIFGSDADRIMAAIAELSNQMSQIDAKIDSVIKKMEMKDITDFLNSYYKEIGPYKALFKDFQKVKSLYSGDDAASIANKNQFLLDIYYKNDPSLTRLGLNITGMVREIKAMLVDDIETVNGIPCNVFGAFDLLEKHVNPWEHQGYDIRNQFRNTALGVFTDFSFLAEMACEAAIEDAKKRNDAGDLRRAEDALSNLKDHQAAVDKMETRCAVIEHPDLRIFRGDKGEDIYAFHKDVQAVSVSELGQSQIEEEKYKKKDYIISGMIPSPGEQNIISMLFKDLILSNQAMYALRDIREFYGKQKEGYSKTLYDILFDSEQGNFNNVGHLKRGTGFTGNWYQYFEYTSHPFWGPYAEHRRWDATNFLTDTAGIFDKESPHRLLRLTHKQNGWTVDHWNDEKYFSVVHYFGLINQGTLQEIPLQLEPNDGLISGMNSFYELPYTDPVILSVEPKAGATYQWFVYKGDSEEDFEEIEGEVEATYTLPQLHASMNGWMYRCAIMEEDISEWGEGYTLADTVLLTLTGWGVPVPVTEHDVSNEEELAEALSKVTDGTWDGHTIRLTEDMTYANPITLLDHGLTIDLNSHSLTLQPGILSDPNVNPQSNKAETAAIYAHRGNLQIVGKGELNVAAGQGVDYGVYVYASEVTVNDITSTIGGTGVYVIGDGKITADSISATGEDSYAIKNFGGTVNVKGDVTANGQSSCGVHADSLEGLSTEVYIEGNLTTSGDNSRGATLTAENTYVQIEGNVTVNGEGASGLFASNGNYSDTYMVWVYGDVTASDVALNASAGAGIRVSGNVTSSAEGASAICAVGGSVTVDGDVSATGINGTAISASKWDLMDEVAGAFVIVDGNITAYTPLRFEFLPVGENDHTGETAVFGHYIYTDGTNTLWANKDSFVSTDINAKAPSILSHPQDETVDPGIGVTLTVQAQASDGGVLSYQWYSNIESDFSSGIAIEGATNPSYMAPTETLGTRYYYVIVTNTNNEAAGEKTAQVISRLAAVTAAYRVTFDKNGGDTEASPATKEITSIGNVGTLPTAPTRAGYSFNGWNTEANGSGTVFTAATTVTGPLTVYAQWTGNSSGGGGGTSPSVETPKTETNVHNNTVIGTTTVKATAGSSGNVTAIVSRAQLSDAISKAMEEAGKQGEGTVSRVEIKVEAPENTRTAETIIPKEAVSQASKSGVGALTLSTPVASITFDVNTLSALSEEAVGDVKISTSKVETSSLSPEAQRTVGDRPVFDFTVTSGDKKIYEFRGDVSVSVLYTPKEGEDTNAIVIYYINDLGELEVVSNCVYDSGTGRVSFSTRHFSQYAVGYNEISFKDVAKEAWYSKAVGFIGAREITTGAGGGHFNPEAKLTRGQFMVMLMKAYGISPDLNPKDNFADAGDTYYTGYLAMAKGLGISAGVGNNLFDPEKEITRQEMFTLLYNALKVIGKLPVGTAGKPLTSFADAENIASWAKEAMTLLVETGTISGNGGELSPMSTTTRAEMAQVLYNMLSTVVPGT